MSDDSDADDSEERHMRFRVAGPGVTSQSTVQTRMRYGGQMTAKLGETDASKGRRLLPSLAKRPLLK